MREILRRFIGTRDYWSIGIYKGDSPYHLIPHKEIKNPVLRASDVTDRGALFVADPFMLYENGIWYIFFEVLDRKTKKGEIGLAVSKDGLNWKYQQIVLSESFHISYPYVFKFHEEFYMIPESHSVKAVRLYKAELFPFHWKFVGNLLNGSDFVDSSVVNYQNRWWLFTCPTTNSDILKLFYADDLMGPWIEHPGNPIINGNAHIARCGGRIIVFGDKIIRYAQDDKPLYGNNLHAFEITKLTEKEYEEKGYFDNPISKVGRRNWNSRGMHCIDPHFLSKDKWIACVDGNQRRFEIRNTKKHNNS